MPKFILVLILIFLPSNIYGTEFSGYLKTYLVSQDKKNIEAIVAKTKTMNEPSITSFLVDQVTF